MYQLLRRISAVLLILMMGGVNATAQTAKAMLAASGDVKVNGVAVPESSALMNGEVITTGPNSSAKITAENLDVTVPPNSTLTFVSNALTLGCGSASIFTKGGSMVLKTADGSTTITPAAGEGFDKIEVTQAGGRTVIAVTAGSAVVTQGDQTATVNSGYKLDLEGNSCGMPAAPTAPPQNVPPAQGGAQPPVLNTPHHFNKLIPILIGAGAATGVGIYFAVRDEGVVTPARP